jgi:hypothetical protein
MNDGLLNTFHQVYVASYGHALAIQAFEPYSVNNR